MSERPTGADEGRPQAGTPLAGAVDGESFGSQAGSPRPVLLRARLAYAPGDLREDRRRIGTPAGGSSEQAGLWLQVDFCITTPRTVLFGPSGSGKSTVLRLLAGLLQPADGSITLLGRTLTDTAARIAVPPGRRGIGYLTQEPALFPHLSVEANVAYGLHGMERAACHVRVAAMLAIFSLEPLAHRLPLRLSGGERQRVALARALAPSPSLLLLDEPFAGLDADLREKTVAALDQYLAASATIVLSVSHDVAEVYASKAEVLMLEAGRILQQGPGHTVLALHRERLLQQLGGIAKL